MKNITETRPTGKARSASDSGGVGFHMLRFVFLIGVVLSVSELSLSRAAHGQIFAIQNRQVGVFAAWAATSGVQIVTGDFNGDGRTDIALVRREAGWTSIPVALSNETNIAFTIQ